MSSGKVREEILKLTMVVNGSPAQKELHQLGLETKTLVEKNKELKEIQRKLAEQGRKTSVEFKNLSLKIEENSNAIQSNEKRMFDLRMGMDNTALTATQLKQKMNDLKWMIANMVGNNPLREKYIKDLKETKAQLDSMGVKAKSTGMTLRGMADSFNRYFAMTTALVASLTGIIMGFRKLSEDVAKMDDTYSDVMKTTGLTRNQVEELNDEFKKMDTRTSRESLNMLARDAGKLGIEGKKTYLIL